MDEAEKLTPYDIFIGVLLNFPKGKNRFIGNYSDILDFLEEQKQNYSMLKRFTRSQFEDGLNILLTGGMLAWWSSSPRTKEFNPKTIAYSFKTYNKERLFGEEGMKQVKDLSGKFVETFGKIL